MRKGVALLAILILASSAAAEDDSAKALVNEFYYCVGRATARQPDRFKSPEIVVERAFAACSTEEAAIRSYAELNHIPLAQTNAIMVGHRSKLKRAFVEKLQEGGSTSSKPGGR